MVSTLYHYSQHGDPAVSALVKHLLTQVSKYSMPVALFPALYDPVLYIGVPATAPYPP